MQRRRVCRLPRCPAPPTCRPRCRTRSSGHVPQTHRRSAPSWQPTQHAGDQSFPPAPCAPPPPLRSTPPSPLPHLLPALLMIRTCPSPRQLTSSHEQSQHTGKSHSCRARPCVQPGMVRTLLFIQGWRLNSSRLSLCTSLAPIRSCIGSTPSRFQLCASLRIHRLEGLH